MYASIRILSCLLTRWWTTVDDFSWSHPSILPHFLLRVFWGGQDQRRAHPQLRRHRLLQLQSFLAPNSPERQEAQLCLQEGRWLCPDSRKPSQLPKVSVRPLRCRRNARRRRTDGGAEGGPVPEVHPEEEEQAPGQDGAGRPGWWAAEAAEEVPEAEVGGEVWSGVTGRFSAAPPAKLFRRNQQPELPAPLSSVHGR